MLSMLFGLNLLFTDHFKSVLDASLLMRSSHDYSECSRSYLNTKVEVAKLHLIFLLILMQDRSVMLKVVLSYRIQAAVIKSLM